jgi:hypothetical protein
VPDITTPGALTFTPGTFRTPRIVPARLRYTAGSVMTQKDSPTTAPAVVPVLERLRRTDAIMAGDNVDVRYQLLWQRTMEAIEKAFTAVNQRVDEIAILSRLSTVEMLAQTARDEAVKAASTVETVSAAVEQTFTEIDPVYGDQFNDRLEQ